MRRAPLTLLRYALLLGCVGCGLAEYEARMTEAQKKAAQADEETKHLEGPLQLPQPQKVNPMDPDPTDFFFRPPRGLSTMPGNPDAKGVPRPLPNLPGYLSLYEYPRQMKDGKPATADNPGLEGLYVALVPDQSETALKGFITDVLRRFQTARDPAAQKARTYNLPDGRTLTYDTWTFDNTEKKESYFACFIRSNKSLVALVFRAEQGKLMPLSKALDASLQSLGVGPDASGAQMHFQDSQRWVPPKK
jgi:hypothetical protein